MEGSGRSLAAGAAACYNNPILLILGGAKVPLVIFESVSSRLRVARRGWAFAAVIALLALAPLAAGCSPRTMAQAATATPSQPGDAVPSPTVTPAAGATEPAGTPTVRPTPSGPPPTPENVLNVFNFFPSEDTLVKRDLLNLDGDDMPEVLFTITEPGITITEETASALRVLDYDPTYREWKPVWVSEPITGTASPLPAANRADGYNGGDLLRTGAHIFLARTSTLDGHAHLYMWQWDASKQTATRLKMAPPGGGPERDSFEGELDVQVADLDNDSVYEVVADNLASVQVWKWDGSKYAPEGGSR
jgi:hypothetical protein